MLAGERATVVGAGSIDLVLELWNLELVPEAHDPSLLEVASAVRVTGPLANPHFAPILALLAPLSPALPVFREKVPNTQGPPYIRPYLWVKPGESESLAHRSDRHTVRIWCHCVAARMRLRSRRMTIWRMTMINSSISRAIAITTTPSQKANTTRGLAVVRKSTAHLLCSVAAVANELR